MNTGTKGFLVALRIAVGWHFLYEGLWKIDSDTGSAVYATSRYTLQASTARMRDYFERSVPGTLQLQPALAHVDAWHDEIVKSFAAQKALSEDQKARLADLRDKVKVAAASAIRGEAGSDEVVNFDWGYVHEEVLKVAADEEGERFTSLPYLQESAGPFRGVFRGMVRNIDGVERLTAASAQARVDERYRQILEHYASAGKPFGAEQQLRLAKARDAVKASVTAMLSEDAVRLRLADYRLMRDRVADDAPLLHAPFTRERLDADRKKMDIIAAELLALVNEPMVELAVQANAIATVDQMSAGPLPRSAEPSGWIDGVIMFSLTAIGLCLLLGLFTPVAALAAVGQLAMFYFASPPWPGLPAATTGGHYLYVDRNLIEMVAGGLIAVSGSGTWAGLDAYLTRYWKRRGAVQTLPEQQERQQEELAESALRS